jgi:hypothetical protein
LRALLWFVAYMLWATHLSTQPSEADLQLIEDVTSREEALVSIWIEVDGVVRGKDSGVLWWDDEGLHFYGHRCFFRIAHQDFVGIVKPILPSPFFELAALTNMGIELKTSDSRLRIGLRGLNYQALKITRQKQLLPLMGILTSYSTASGKSTQPSRMPPTNLDPEFRGLALPLVGTIVFTLAFGGSCWYVLMTHFNLWKAIEGAAVAWILLRFFIPMIFGIVRGTIVRQRMRHQMVADKGLPTSEAGG